MNDLLSNIVLMPTKVPNGLLDVGMSAIAHTISALTTPVPEQDIVVEEPAYNFITVMVWIDDFRYNEDCNITSYWTPETDNVEITYLQPPFAMGSNKLVFLVSHPIKVKHLSTPYVYSFFL